MTIEPLHMYCSFSCFFFLVFHRFPQVFHRFSILNKHVDKCFKVLYIIDISYILHSFTHALLLLLNIYVYVFLVFKCLLVVYWRFYMKFNLYCVYNHIDKSCDAPVVGRSDERVAVEFANSLYRRNKESVSKGLPPISPSEFSLWKVGVFDDSSGVVESIERVSIPFSVPVDSSHKVPN